MAVIPMPGATPATTTAATTPSARQPFLSRISERTHMSQLRRMSLMFGGAMALASAPVSANPRPLPFSYQHEQLAAGDTEIEQFADFTPVRVLSESSGNPAWYGFTQFQTELE